MKHRILALLAGSFLFVLAGAAQPPAEEANDLLYACEASYRLQGADLGPNWCKCQSTYYSNLMTTADWRKYSRDYFALRDLQDSGEPTEANSYARRMQLGRDHCAACNQNGYRGCISSNVDPREAQRSMVEAIATGNFSQVSRNTAYKQMFTRYIEAYSRQCRSRINSGKLIIREYSSKDSPTERVEVAVEYPFLDSYKAYSIAATDAVTAESVRVLGDILTSGNPFDPTSTINMGMKLAALDGDMNDMVSDCGSDFGKALHENLRRFDAGEAPLKTLAASTSTAASAASRRAMIEEFMAEAYERAKKRWAAAEQKRLSEVDARSGFTCSNERWYTPDSARARAFSSYPSFTGGWRGELFGREAEMITWGRRFDPLLQGLLYFPGESCLMEVSFSSQLSMKQVVEVRMNEGRSQIGMCKEVMGPKGQDSQRSQINGSFYLEPDSTGKQMTLAPYTLSPGFRAVNGMGFDGSCEGKPAFSKGPVSQAMRQRIRDEVTSWGQHSPGWLPPKRDLETILSAP